MEEEGNIRQRELSLFPSVDEENRLILIYWLILSDGSKENERNPSLFHFCHCRVNIARANKKKRSNIGLGRRLEKEKKSIDREYLLVGVHWESHSSPLFFLFCLSSCTGKIPILPSCSLPGFQDHCKTYLNTRSTSASSIDQNDQWQECDDHYLFS